jgi:hypothetical protein
MALLFLESFDKYGPVNSNPTSVNAMLTAGEWTSAGVNWSVVAGLSSTGQAISGGMGGALPLVKTLSANYSRLIGGVRFASNLVGGFAAGVGFGDAGAVQCTITINPAGTISLRNGLATSATILATSGTSVSANSTHYLEWDITFGNSAAYQVWLDGVSLFSGTGDTTTTANNTANQFILAASVTATITMTYDDLYLFDSTGTTNNAVLLTSPRVETTFPTSDSAVQFAFGAGILGSNAARVATTSAPAAGSLVLRRFTPAVAGTLASITIMPGGTSAPANYRGVCYADSGGTAPGTLMSSGTQVTGVTSGTAATLPLTTPQSLSAGTQYWIGFINDTAVVLQQSDGSTLGYRAANTYASGAPGTAPAMTSGQASWLLWGNLTGISGANYNEVTQQPPPGAQSYVFDATVGHEDLYNFGALSTSPAFVYAVAVKGYIQKSDAGAKTISLRMKSSATDSAGSLAGQTPATTYGWMTSLFPTDPNGSIAWTGTALNAATSGFRVDS